MGVTAMSPHPPGGANPSPAAAPAAKTATSWQQIIDSATLLQGARSVTIRHNGEYYRLQVTRQGKLILTK